MFDVIMFSIYSLFICVLVYIVEFSLLCSFDLSLQVERSPQSF